MHIISLIKRICHWLSEVQRISSHNVPFRVSLFRLMLVVTRVIHSNILFWQLVVYRIGWWNYIANGDIAWHGLDVVYGVVKSVSVVDSVEMRSLDLVGLVVNKNYFEVVVSLGGDNDALHFDVAGELNAGKSDALVSGVRRHV